MKKISLSIITLLIFNFSFSQKISKSDWSQLKTKEDSMQSHALELIRGINPSDRMTADSIFTKMLVRSLKVNNSFYYPFESLITISMLYPPDSSFKIFTWQLVIDENTIRHHGAIQMKTADGSLKLFPLIDKSDFISNTEDTITDNFSWIGAIYYKLIEKSFGDKKFYTLIGFDENNIRSSKKVIEVLTFENEKPVFGGYYFMVPDDQIKHKSHCRYIMEFQKDAGPRLTFDDEMNIIVKEHLVSESNEPQKKWTLIGDGDYEGFQWLNRKWVYISKVFNEVTPEGKAPTPVPVKEDKRINVD
jgi:hypothetical protein